MRLVEWHHRLNGHEFEPTPEHSEGQGSLACCSSGGHKESDDKATEQPHVYMKDSGSRTSKVFCPLSQAVIP